MSLTLTDRDKSCIACLYEAATGIQIDAAVCIPAGAAAPGTKTFGPFDIATDDLMQLGEFAVDPGSRFRAVMSGDGDSPGDPDLYVTLDGLPPFHDYGCRPYNVGLEEACDFDVPQGKTKAAVAVHGYTAGRFLLTISSAGQ